MLAPIVTVTTIRERLGWEVTPELCGRVRHLWIDHSKAEVVIGPQGVIEIAIVIHFPWDPRAELFSGERIYYDSGALVEQLAAPRP